MVKYPDVFLRNKSHEVKFPLDDKTERLIKWMTKQLPAPRHRFSCCSSWVFTENICNGLHDRETKSIYKPRNCKKSDETLRDSEGCLSAPKQNVKRHLRIILKYKTEDGKERKTFTI